MCRKVGFGVTGGADPHRRLLKSFRSSQSHRRRDVAQTLMSAAPRLISALLVYEEEARQECRAGRLKPAPRRSPTSSECQVTLSKRLWGGPPGLRGTPSSRSFSRNQVLAAAEK